MLGTCANMVAIYSAMRSVTNVANTEAKHPLALAHAQDVAALAAGN